MNPCQLHASIPCRLLELPLCIDMIHSVCLGIQHDVSCQDASMESCQARNMKLAIAPSMSTVCLSMYLMLCQCFSLGIFKCETGVFLRRCRKGPLHGISDWGRLAFFLGERRQCHPAAWLHETDHVLF